MLEILFKISNIIYYARNVFWQKYWETILTKFNPNRLASLQKQHAELESKIKELKAGPGSDDLEIADLKKQKLALKEQIVEQEKLAEQENIAA